MNKLRVSYLALAFSVLALTACSNENSSMGRFLAQFGLQPQGEGSRSVVSIGRLRLPVFVDNENSDIAIRYREFVNGTYPVIDLVWLQKRREIRGGVYILHLSEFSHAVLTQGVGDG